MAAILKAASPPWAWDQHEPCERERWRVMNPRTFISTSPCLQLACALCRAVLPNRLNVSGAAQEAPFNYQVNFRPELLASARDDCAVMAPPLTRPGRINQLRGAGRPRIAVCPARGSRAATRRVTTMQPYFRVASKWPPRVLRSSSQTMLFPSSSPSSIKVEVKKKHPSRGRNFSCFAAHLIEQDLF